MANYNELYDEAVYEARMVGNFQKYEQKKQEKKQQIIDRLREDLNFTLVKGRREFLKKCVFSTVIDKYEHVNYFSRQVFTPTGETSYGFNPKTPELAALVDKFNMRDGTEGRYDSSFLKSHFYYGVYREGYRNVDDETPVESRVGFTAWYVTPKTVKEVIDNQVWRLYNALKDGNEGRVENCLTNIRATIEVNNYVQNRWNNIVSTRVLDEEITSRIERETSRATISNHKFKDVDIEIKFHDALAEPFAIHKENYEKLKSVMKEGLIDAIDKEDRRAFFNTLNIDNPEYKKYIETMKECNKEITEIDKKFVAMDEDKTREKEEKARSEYSNIAKKYEQGGLIPLAEQMQLEKMVVLLVNMKPSSVNELCLKYTSTVKGFDDMSVIEKVAQRNAFKFFLKKMINEKKIRFDARGEHLIPMTRDIKMDAKDNGRKNGMAK